jgi:hypothetical protein
MYENELTQEASDRIDGLRARGYSYKQIIDFLQDGEALKKEGYTNADENLTNEMYQLLSNWQDNEETAKQSD